MPRGSTTGRQVRALMERLGRAARGPGRIYLVGGASAVLIGWRDTTVDVDLKLHPEPAGIFGAIAEAKNALDVNIELSAPDDFIPRLPDWEARSPIVARHGRIDFLHYDFYGQALAKIERGHRQDVADVSAMHRLGLVEPTTLLRMFDSIVPGLERYPALDADLFAARVRETVSEMERATQPRGGKP
jgi:hypothetical protein